MKSFLTYAAAGFALLSPFAADAADLAVKAPPATPAAAVYNWTGMYIGVNGGYGWGKHDPLDLIAGGFDPGRSFNTSGGFIGGTIGAQIQQGYVVMGAEERSPAYLSRSRSISQRRPRELGRRESERARLSITC
ncbi:opacity protein-like surface antigen [Bradyrhizobium sp. USDA 4448]